MNIYLTEMTNKLARIYYQNFEMDPILFDDQSKFRPYKYSAQKCDETVERHKRLGRVFLAIMLDKDPIGEIILKDIDHSNRSCTLSIHLQNDNVKNKGYGTQSEILAIQYAFKDLKLDTVYADAIHKNTRSQRVLSKAGFCETHRDHTFIYYRCDRSCWAAENEPGQV